MGYSFKITRENYKIWEMLGICFEQWKYIMDGYDAYHQKCIDITRDLIPFKKGEEGENKKVAVFDYHNTLDYSLIDEYTVEKHENFIYRMNKIIEKECSVCVMSFVGRNKNMVKVYLMCMVLLEMGIIDSLVLCSKKKANLQEFTKGWSILHHFPEKNVLKCFDDQDKNCKSFDLAISNSSFLVKNDSRKETDRMMREL